MTILDTIGSTPLVRLSTMVPDAGAAVWLKLEYMSPGGSMKDRVARQIVEDAEASGALRPGGTIVELTSGNTGTGLAIVCRTKGYRMVAVMSEGNSVERRRMMLSLGAEVEIVPQAGAAAPGKVSKEDLDLVEARARQITRELGAFRADQFNNPSNPRAHELGTGPEILRALDADVTAFVAAVGSGGLFTGVAQALKSASAETRCYAVEPMSAPHLAGAEITDTRHKIQGVGYAVTPGFWNESLVDGYIGVSDADATATARRLARDEGVIAGFSSGANVWAALGLAAKLPPEATVVTVACDSGMKYLSTDLYE
ncbi:MAG: cysteine synthase family protein [Candidatus Poribacteria bacterium]